MVARMPLKARKRREDILGRVLKNKDTEEDCIRAETSQVMVDEEVQERVRRRQAELALTCGAPLHINMPDVTSTPRADFGSVSESPGPILDRPGPSRRRSVRLLHKQSDNPSNNVERETLRSGRGHNQTLDWDVSIDDEAAQEDLPPPPEEAEQPHQNSGLNLDADGINALAHHLKETIPNAVPPPLVRDPLTPNKKRNKAPPDPPPLQMRLDPLTTGMRL